MPPQKSAIRKEAERLAVEMPNATTQSLARRLAKEFGDTLENARQMVRIARGEAGEKGRKKYAVTTRKKAERKKGPKLPPPLVDPWKPFKISGPFKATSLSDIHIPFHDVKALTAAVKQTKSFKPDVLLLNGDTCDFYKISRWTKDPRKRKFSVEQKKNEEFLAWIRSEFPNARIIFKKGNHEERWDHYLWNHAPELADCDQMLLENWLNFDKYGIEMVEDQRPILLGKLTVFHGHELPKGLTNPVNMARGAFLRMIDTVLVGHGHRSSSHTEANWKHEEITCWSQGCLCDMNPEYARINKWNHGKADIVVAKNGEFNVDNIRINTKGAVRKS